MTKTKRHIISDKKLKRLTSLASVSVATILVLAKIAAYFYTDSIALLSSLIDSSVDVLASLITAFGVTKALQPPDRDHRYGHAKAESLVALAQAAFIVGSALFLSFEAIGRFAKPVPLAHTGLGHAVMIIAIVATAGLLTLQTYTVRRTGSQAIAADRMHYAGDILMNLVVMISMAAQDFFQQPWVDPLFALLIAAFLARGAFGIAGGALAVLMDAELPETDRLALFSLAASVPGVLGVHDLRTRSDSERPIIELHIEMDGQINLKDAHRIVEDVTAKIKTAYPKADVLIHQDPAGIEEERLDALIEENDPLPK